MKQKMLWLRNAAFGNLIRRHGKCFNMAAGSGETVQTVPRGQDQGRQKQVKEQLARVLK